MNYSLHFIPEIEEDTLAGYFWYEDKAKGLGEEFLRTFYACVNEIPRNPLLYSKVHNEFRRLLLRRFPYAIYFRIEDKKIIVFGLIHCARNPHMIKTELQKRNH